MSLEVLLLAVAFDLLLGEPPARIHPVVWIGKLISYLRQRLKPTCIRGLLLVIVVITITILAAHILIKVTSPVPFIPLLISACLLKSTFSIKYLLEVSSNIGKMIDQDLSEAKNMLPALVGRETKGLTKSQVISAVIESLSENYVDSILSPIFYYLLFEPLGFGVEAAMGFKAISTMDSMLGYKTVDLKELGFAAAKLDDLANFIPARLSVIFMVMAKARKSRYILKAASGYHNRTPSPNSGWPMSACAGALGIRLEKPGYYVLLDEGKEPETLDIVRAVRFIETTIALSVASSVLLLSL